ncbi:MAG: universal stress protein [Spartobacteria bacterium]|nr:universal stress protein [Spartobacteria bacterium]
MNGRFIVCTDGSAYADTAVEFAMELAGRMKAKSLKGIHVLNACILEAPMMGDSMGWLGVETYGVQVEQFREILHKKGEGIRDAFLKKTAPCRMEVKFDIVMGMPAHAIIDAGNDADWIVLGQKGEDAQWLGKMIGSTAERLTRYSTKPCIVTPEKCGPVTHVLAAYDGSDHARQALVKASEMAKELDLKITLITVIDAMKDEHAARINDEGAALVQSYGLTVDAHIETGIAEERILAAIKEYQCDVLFVGAYGHSRIREMVLGSTTVHLIARSAIPVVLLK